MIVKKKGLYLGLLLSMLGVGNAMQAWEVSIRNSTPFSVEFELSLRACSNDHGLIPPGHIIKVSVKGCSIQALTAKVFQKKGAGTILEATGAAGVLGETIVEANPYTSARTGDTIFIINGPYLSSDPKYAKQGGIFYQVDRSTTKWGKFPS